MKIGLSVAIAVLLAAVSVSAGAQDFRIVVELTIGEKSKDSSSQTTVITVDHDAAVWQQTISSGRRGGEREHVQRKRFELSSAERQKLIDVIAANELLTSDSLTLPLRPPVFYFALRMKLAVGAAEGAIEIAGPRSADEVRRSSLYKRTLNVLKELYAIMDAQDNSITFEEPLRAER